MTGGNEVNYVHSIGRAWRRLAFLSALGAVWAVFAGAYAFSADVVRPGGSSKSKGASSSKSQERRRSSMRKQPTAMPDILDVLSLKPNGPMTHSALRGARRPRAASTPRAVTAEPILSSTHSPWLLRFAGTNPRSRPESETSRLPGSAAVRR